MTLIDKQKPSLKVNNKRPLTVSRQFLCVLTKILNERMTAVSERENLYGSKQYGFRAGRFTSDCIFLLLAGVRNTRRKKYTISVAFCDLKKAYDSVNREILYDVLTDSGFGGRVLTMYQCIIMIECRFSLGTCYQDRYGFLEELSKNWRTGTEKNL